MQLSNYLFFTTTCEQALAFYAQCGLGKVTEVMLYGAHGMPVKTEAMRSKIMHAKFEGPGVLFFASDNDEGLGSDLDDERSCLDGTALRFSRSGRQCDHIARGSALGRLLRQADRSVRGAVDIQLFDLTSARRI